MSDRLTDEQVKPIDYRALLAKYMAGVISAEGISFADRALSVTVAEMAELMTIETETRLKRTLNRVHGKFKDRPI